jgi:DUF1009 family protein
VKDEDLLVDIPQAKKMNKEVLDKAVNDRLNELGKQFRERDEYVQRVVMEEQDLTERQNDTKSRLRSIQHALHSNQKVQNIMKLDTGNFIKTI